MASETGSAELPDIGELSYNGVTFSSLYTSSVSGKPVLDASGRTVKYMEYTISVDGMVTMDDDVFDATTDRIWANLRKQLDAQAGVLTYTGKGFGSPFVVNQPGGIVRDVAWGPIPKTLEFIPMGASRSAKIKWQVTTCIPEIQPLRAGNTVLQFNMESALTYDDAGYTGIVIKGTLEIPLTRATQGDKLLTTTVDAFRQRFMTTIAAQIDLTRFKVVKRDFPVSRDDRTMEWVFAIEELPPMGPPAGMLVANGSYTVKPEKAGASLVRWICTLRGTYIVPKPLMRRLAGDAFVSLWQFRMRQSQLANFNPNFFVVRPFVGLAQDYLTLVKSGFNTPNMTAPVMGGAPFVLAQQTAIPISFSVTEGVYDDSKSVTFEASWRLTCTLDLIMRATGVWRTSGVEGGTNWAIAARDISGWKSWLENRVDPASLAIVDFGS